MITLSTIKDIARETGLSLATISKYMNGGHVLDQNPEGEASGRGRGRRG